MEVLPVLALRLLFWRTVAVFDQMPIHNDNNKKNCLCIKVLVKDS